MYESRDGLLDADRARRVVSVSVTTPRVVAAMLGLHALLFAVVVLPATWTGAALLRAIVAVSFLTVVPGFLVLRLFGISPRAYSTGIAYVVGLSLVALMLVGTVANFGLRAVGVAQPIEALPLVASITATTLAMTALYAWRVREDTTIRVTPAAVTAPSVLGLALLPFLAVYGALVLTRFEAMELTVGAVSLSVGANLPLVVLYLLIAAIPVLAVLGRLDARLFPYAIWIVAVSLLLQNALTGQFLAWGDQPKEANLALSVLRTGYWEPALAPGFGAKFTMLRIVILHPIYALVADLQLVWVFKLVHPLVFSVAPVALYGAYRRYVPDRIAFVSAFFYVSLFSFFVVLSRNTRTATAILFLALLALVIADRELPIVHAKLLAIPFTAAVVVSHYGVSYIVLFALAAVLPLTWVLGRYTIRSQRTVTTPVFVGLYLAITFAWYIFASPGAKAFGLVVGFIRSFTTRLYTEFLVAPESTSATTRYVTTDFSSVVIDGLRVYNIVLGAIIVVGLAATLWRLYRHMDDGGFDAEYLAFAAVFLGVFAVTFLPVERFNTARTYATTLVFFAPFLAIGVRELLGPLRRVTRAASVPVGQVAAVLVVAYFLLNVGFVSATVVHEYSPNALVEKDRIMDDGHPEEKTYFYKQYPTATTVASTSWLEAHGANNTTRYQSGWPGNPAGAIGYASVDGPPARDPTFRDRPITHELVTNDTRFGPGYVYLNAYSWRGNVIRLPAGHFEFASVETRAVQSHWRSKDRVYDNGDSVVFY